TLPSDRSRGLFRRASLSARMRSAFCWDIGHLRLVIDVRGMRAPKSEPEGDGAACSKCTRVRGIKGAAVDGFLRHRGEGEWRDWHAHSLRPQARTRAALTRRLPRAILG